jgi:26S proteasome regulatory subunit N3
LLFLLPFQSSRGIGNCKMQIVATFMTGPPTLVEVPSNIACATSTHCACLQAMRYPLNAHRKELQSAEAAREREKELAKEIGDLDDEGDGGPGLGET